jgi:protein-S-isoprenylcysteine O-methyltransferase Ste14
MVPHIDDARPANLIVFISECVITAFALCHRPTEQISRVPSEWLLAISVSFMPTLIAPMEESSNFPVAISVGLMTFGFLLATTAKLFLARSFGVVPANRGVCARGPYMFVRHPVYAGYFITYIGFLTAYPAAWNLFVYGLVGVLQIRRILAEEALLSQDRAYQDYKRTVPYRLLPGLF